MPRPTFEQAKTRYVNRYTMEHVPGWTQIPCENGKYYAPQFRTDAEWYENTLFPEETDCPCSAKDKYCFTTNQSWPLGPWLDAPFHKQRR